jgi:hypothetical protein
MPMLTNTNSNKLAALLVKVSIILLISFLLFIVGAYTALAPQLVARLLPIFIILVVIAMALLSHSEQDLSDKTLKRWLAILLTTMALWPSYLLIKTGGLPALDARRIVAGLTLGAAIYLTISRAPLKYRFKELLKGPLGVGTVLLVAYMMMRLASCFVSVSTFYSITQVVWESLYYYSMFFVGAILFSKQNLQSWVVKVFMLLAIFIAFYTCIEWVIQKNILTRFASKDLVALQMALSTSRFRDGFFRAQGTFEHPLLLAEFAAMAVSFSLSAILWGGGNKTLRLLGSIAFVFSIITAILTGSRSALLSVFGAIVFILVVWFFSNDKARLKHKVITRKLLSFSSFLLISIIVFPIIALIVKGGSISETSSTAGRIYMLQLGWESIKSHVLLGTGPGTSGSVAGIVTGAGINTLDNYFLAIVIESGVPAVILLVFFLMYSVWVLFNKIMEDNDSVNRIFLSAVMGSLLVTVLIHTILWMPYNFFFAFLLSGMALSSLSIKPKNKDFS